MTYKDSRLSHGMTPQDTGAAATTYSDLRGLARALGGADRRHVYFFENLCREWV